MIPYYILVIVPYVFSLIFSGRRCENDSFARKLTITSFFFILFCLLALRDTACGIDLWRYELKFNQSAGQSWADLLASERDAGYYLFQKLIRSVTSNFGWLQALVALLSLIGIWYFYYRESEHAPLTVALFLTVAPFTMYFSGLRQVLAMAMVVPAWYCAKHKRWLLFVLSVLLATSLHRSGCVIAVLYPIYHMRITKKWLFFLTPGMLIVLILNKPIFRVLLDLMGGSYYEMSDTGAYTVLILLVLFTVYAFVIPDESKIDSDTAALRNILLLAVFLQCFAPVHTLAMRVNYYFLLFIPVLIPRIARRPQYVWEPMARFSMVVMVLFFTFWFFLQGHVGADQLNVFPYVFRDF